MENIEGVFSDDIERVCFNVNTSGLSRKSYEIDISLENEDYFSYGLKIDANHDKVNFFDIAMRKVNPVLGMLITVFVVVFGVALFFVLR